MATFDSGMISAFKTFVDYKFQHFLVCIRLQSQFEAVNLHRIEK